jgi:hypothetical protein
MPAFNQVSIKGNIDVSLHTGYKKPAIILRGKPEDIKQAVAEVKDKVLFIKIPRRSGPMAVEIRSHHLNGFSFKGFGTVKGNHLHSSLLDLKIDNSGYTTLGDSLVLRKLEASGGGTIQIKGVTSRYLQLDIKDNTKVLLVGVMNLSSLNLEGGWLSMYWVKTPRLTICAKGKANIRLAGVVDKLDVELWGNARFYGRYLRAVNAFVKTHETSFAELTAIKHQHALATDASDIYFYKIPQTKADFMACQGSILDMRDWNRPQLKDYDRFNKESH